jgi:hypothetical protein
MNIEINIAGEYDKDIIIKTLEAVSLIMRDEVVANAVRGFSLSKSDFLEVRMKEGAEEWEWQTLRQLCNDIQHLIDFKLWVVA